MNAHEQSIPRLTLCLAGALLWWAGEAGALEYHVTELPSAPNGINSMGQVVTGLGTWTPTTPNGTTGSMGGGGGVAINDYGQTTASDGQHVLLFTPSAPNGTSGSTTTIVSVPDITDYTEAKGINNQGAVTGRFNVGIDDAFVWIPGSPNADTGQMFFPQIGDRSFSYAYGINDHRQVVGYASTGVFPGAGAYLFTPTSYSNPLIFGVTTILSGDTALAINDLGQAVSNDSQQGFLFTPTAPNGTTGNTTPLGVLPGTSRSSATAINDLGQVVGNSDSTAFLWTNSDGMVNLNNYLNAMSGAGWTLQHATGINDAGQIVGTGIHNGVAHGFLLTPVPEPATIALAALGGLALLARLRLSLVA
ncbi:MAG: DUF3466 family protein [Planctomycetia bacterium]|nr:DUF3466 family protein [Planctomycetia bacterium]